MRKTIRICDSCEKEVPDEKTTWVEIIQIGHRSKFDVCPECLNKVKEMFHLAT